MNSLAKRQERTPYLDKLQDPALFREFAYINGEWCAGDNGETLDVCNPADGNWIGTVAYISDSQSRAAVHVAQDAFKKWSMQLPQERSIILRRWFELMLQHKQDLALLMTLEQGKPLSESLGEIEYAASFLEFYAEEAKRPNIEGVTSHLPDAEMEVWREPVGVAGLVTPWNFPSAMITRKAGAALAAGCAVLVHPSHETPFSGLALAELADRAGVPRGVFNVLSGRARTIVASWMEMPEVRLLSFTGSTEVGRLLYRQGADTVKRLIMELGGHAPFLVFADADLERAVACAISAKFATSGQDCLAANRFFIERTVYAEFCERLVEKVAKLSVGPGMDDPDIGPLMSENAVAKQIEHVSDAVARGARVLMGGDRHEAGDLFFQPTILADVSADALIFSEETFGPIIAIAPFDDEEEALKRANDTEYGLVAYVHTSETRRVYHFTRALQYGMVAVNRTKVTGAPVPFGGVKQSGIGVEGARLGMEAYTQVKYVCRDYI